MRLGGPKEMRQKRKKFGGGAMLIVKLDTLPYGHLANGLVRHSRHSRGALAGGLPMHHEIIAHARSTPARRHSARLPAV